MSKISLTPLVSALAIALGAAGTGGDAQATTPAGSAHGRWQTLRQELAQLQQKLQANRHWAANAQRPHHPHAPKPHSVAATIAVTTCVDDTASLATPGTLRYAVANAGDNGEVDLSSLACSTITLTQGALPVTVGYLTVQGPDAGTVTIDGNAADRVFYQTAPGYLTLSHLTIRNGYATATVQPPAQPTSPNAPPPGAATGGCVYSAGPVYLDHSVVSGCTAGSTDATSVGGGVYAGALYMQSSTISDNTAIVHASASASYGGKYLAVGGGAFAQFIYASNDSSISGNLAIASEGFAIGGGAFSQSSYLVDSSVSGNTAQGIFAVGGGIGASALYLQTSTLSGNTANGMVGTADGDPAYALAIGGGGFAKYAVQLQASTVTGNVAQNNAAGKYAQAAIGGGLAASYRSGVSGTGNGSDAVAAVAPVSISYSTIDHNRAQIGGGMVAKYAMTLAQSTISGNTAQVEGGGLAIVYSGNSAGLYSHFYNSTIANNSAGNYGGGLLLYYGASPTMQSTIIAANIAATGADIYAYQNNSTSGTLTGGSSVEQPSAVTIGGSHNLIMDAANVTLPGDTLTGNPLLQALADNGGPTRTHLLGAGSPAMGTGSNPNNYPYDQRGPGFPRSPGGITNIGSVQSPAAVAAAATPTPALSTWAMGLLAGLLGWFGLRRREKAEAVAKQ
ncbi:MAG: IPTL-CTERM sorting domain-containing protein [Rudaea sp.]